MSASTAAQVAQEARVAVGAIDRPDVASVEPDAAPTLLRCLTLVARHRGLELSAQQLVREHLLPDGEPSIPTFLKIVRASGLRAVDVEFGFSDLLKLGDALPAILLLRNGRAMVLLRADGRASVSHVVLLDPVVGDKALLTLDELRLSQAWSGRTILIKRDYRLLSEEQPFGLGMIVSQVLRDPNIARDITIAAVFMSLCSLAPIMFWRLLVDRVLIHQNISTFYVLCIIMVVLVVFETILGNIKRTMVSYITRRVDVILSTKIFNKIIRLPIEFFETTPAGEVARDVNEIYKIRRFLSGQLFGTVLDSLVVILILPVMLAFSPLLTLCVLGFCGLICGWLLIMLPLIRLKSGAVFKAEGRQSSFLVETLLGIRTVKSLSLDAQRRREWDVHVAQAARLRFEEQRTANTVQTVVQPLERLMTSGVFALAVYMAVTTHDDIYIGALVAFMMLTMRVAAPLAQLATLLPDYDEARLAIDVIARMVNQPPEDGHDQGGLRPPVHGRVEFRDVRFRYRDARSAAIDGVSFTAPAGTTLGIMGRSGSGKTTVTRLLQMLHTNYEGSILLDRVDLRTFDVDYLRSCIGVVMQENFLFSGTLRDAIAAAKPDATLEDVVRAAHLAGAEEFIERLPRGYETWIQEGSTNLSGGQRQRIAIARALITDPRILILDEATSALDAESEAIVNANLRSIAEGRTLIIVSHRLSSLVQADAILVLDRGAISDLGRHEELLARSDIYASLWFQQHRHLRSGAAQ